MAKKKLTEEIKKKIKYEKEKKDMENMTRLQIHEESKRVTTKILKSYKDSKLDLAEFLSILDMIKSGMHSDAFMKTKAACINSQLEKAFSALVKK